MARHKEYWHGWCWPQYTIVKTAADEERKVVLVDKRSTYRLKINISPGAMKPWHTPRVFVSSTKASTALDRFLCPSAQTIPGGAVEAAKPRQSVAGAVLAAPTKSCASTGAPRVTWTSKLSRPAHPPPFHDVWGAFYVKLTDLPHTSRSG